MSYFDTKKFAISENITFLFGYGGCCEEVVSNINICKMLVSQLNWVHIKLSIMQPRSWSGVLIIVIIINLINKRLATRPTPP